MEKTSAPVPVIKTQEGQPQSVASTELSPGQLTQPPQAPGKKSPVAMVVVFGVVLIALVVIVYVAAGQYAGGKPQPSESPFVTPATEEPRETATPTLTQSDKTSDIQKDLDATKLEEDVSSFDEINSDLNAL